MKRKVEGGIGREKGEREREREGEKLGLMPLASLSVSKALLGPAYTATAGGDWFARFTAALMLGAAIGEATVGRRIGRRGMAVGAVTALLPDLDVLGHFFLPHAQQLAFHRGITHSLLIAAILPLILAWLIRRSRPC